MLTVRWLMIPEEAKLVCDVCRDEGNYHPSSLLLFGGTNVVSPNTFWWWHFPKDSKNPPLRCNAGGLFELWLKRHLTQRALDAGKSTPRG